MNMPYASLATTARNQELKKAKGILWFVGVVTILFQGFLFANSKKELDEAMSAELGKNGISLAQIRALPEEQRTEFDTEYSNAFNKVRFIYGAGIGIGAIFVVCALGLDRKPVAATVTGLALYLGSIAVQAAIEPLTIMQGIIVKVLIIIGLISSVKAALAVEKERRSQTPV